MNQAYIDPAELILMDLQNDIETKEKEQQDKQQEEIQVENIEEKITENVSEKQTGQNTENEQPEQQQEQKQNDEQADETKENTDDAINEVVNELDEDIEEDVNEDEVELIGKYEEALTRITELEARNAVLEEKLKEYAKKLAEYESGGMMSDVPSDLKGIVAIYTSYEAGDEKAKQELVDSLAQLLSKISGIDIFKYLNSNTGPKVEDVASVDSVSSTPTGSIDTDKISDELYYEIVYQ